ncbi:hypothetical protein [Clostridium neonatale]|uniref:Uncharacterized protein n=1 Tax=Clostridium neonatale TaxID=137838 RepID=A0AA86JSY8_9CLOT|nr:hypothetical protein [Clostridium neonatale]MBP8314001.1 hypothetical protein [Clostridium neonatale]CAG9701973.1 hypothetical protein CNEO_10437 [Clostridium neonatale]CAG9716718.1 hypothetical protein CNEO_400004 [Clostridium neonatale]CAI3204364.1 hypothetical protein CNEO2_250058 [Clostridium neonatale]CAI3204874.1 hypothetical protein CNEO2_390005 [Clostridium neonatale]
MRSISTKHICNFKCKICGKEFTTGWCKTRLGRWIKKKRIMREHYHTMAEEVFHDEFGIYIPTAKKAVGKV